MKIIIILFFSVISLASANPEIGNDGPIHFVMNANNADQEYKTHSGAYSGGVYPNGDGTEWGEIICRSKSSTIPWYKVTGSENAESIHLDSSVMPGTPCELFDSSNNAGNNQGHNVTQYISDAWFMNATTRRNDETGIYHTRWHQRCDNGLQQ